MAEIRVGVSDAFDDRELSRIPELLEHGEFRVEPGRCVDRERVLRADGQAAVLSVVELVVDRHDGVEAVVATEHADDDQDAVVGTRRPGRPHRRVEAGQRQIEQRARGSGERASPDAEPDELEEAATVEGVGIGVGHLEVAEGVGGGDVGVEHDQARCISGASRTRSSALLRSQTVAPLA